jgi:hypothetical protein
MQLLQQLTKADALNFAPQVIESIESGTVSAVEFQTRVKLLETALKSLNESDRYKSLLLEDAAKFGSKFEAYGAKFQTKEAGVKYDYSQCNHPELYDLELQAAELQVKIKAIQKQLQTLPLEGVEYLFFDEVIRIYPPAKTSTTILQTTLL